MREYKWMDLDDVLKSIPAMNKESVSEVARGIEKSKQTREGWVQAYIATGGDPVAMAKRLTGRNDHETWKDRRQQFLARHLGRVKKDNEPLWKNGQPTRRHLALVAWGYTPDIGKYRKWLKTQPSLSSNEWKRGVKIVKKNPPNFVFNPYVELMKVEDLLPFREYDRKLYGIEGERINELDELYQSGVNVFYEPLILGYSKKDNSLLLIEGNHRLKLAQLNKINFIPVTVIRFNNWDKEQALKAIEPSHRPDRIQAEMKPSEFGLKSVPITKFTNEQLEKIMGIGKHRPYQIKENPSIGYNSWAWTTQDWRSLFLHSDGSISYDKKCGAEGTKLPSGKPRLCLPLYVIQKLLKSKSGKEILTTQIKKKQRAKKGQRIAWHPRIKELHAEVEAMTPEDKPSMRKNPDGVKIRILKDETEAYRDRYSWAKNSIIAEFVEPIQLFRIIDENEYNIIKESGVITGGDFADPAEAEHGASWGDHLEEVINFGIGWRKSGRLKGDLYVLSANGMGKKFAHLEGFQGELTEDDISWEESRCSTGLGCSMLFNLDEVSIYPLLIGESQTEELKSKLHDILVPSIEEKRKRSGW